MIPVICTTPPLPAKTEHCQSCEGCTNPAERQLGLRWFCNYHFYRLWREIEMNNDEPEAA